MATPKQKPLCVYCGECEGTTVDHVVPRCLFLPPLPNNMLTVPACEVCNGSKSGDDEYLRDMLVIDWENAPHPMAQGEMKNKVIRSIGKNRSHMVREGRESRRPAPLVSPGGIHLGSAPAIQIEHARIDRTFSRIVRGLYYRLFNEHHLPANSTFEIGKIHPMAKERTIAIFNRPGARAYSLGDSFDCVFVIPNDAPSVTIWLLRFLNVFVIVTTNAAKHLPVSSQVRSSGEAATDVLNT